MRRHVLLSVVMSLAVAVSMGVQAQQPAADSTAVKPDSTQTQSTMLDSVAAADIIYASYFHGDRRCPTCMKLEAYSREAIQAAFDKELKDSAVVFRTVNWDNEENAHYVNDYQLYTKALILSRVRAGKEVAWKNLDSIWQLVNDKDKFVKYVQDQTRAFLAPPSD